MATKDRALSHSENRLKLCLVCLRKAKALNKLQPAIIKILENNTTYNPNDIFLPSSICNSCRFIVFKANKENDKERLSTILPDYSQFYLTPLLRRKPGEKCSCKLCEFVRFGGDFSFNKNTNPNNQRVNHEKIAKQKSTEKDVLVDLKHRINNELTEKQKEQLTSELIKTVLKSKPADSEMSLSQTRGRSLRIAVNPPKRTTTFPPISASDVSKLKTSLGFTTNQTLGMASGMRVLTRSRKLFEPGLKRKLSDINRTLNDYFNVDEIEVIHVVGAKTTTLKKPFVYCTDIPELCQIVEEVRQSEENHFKIGIDGGGGFLKITLSIQAIQDNTPKRKRQRYADGVGAKKFKDSGVKKLFLLGIVPSTQENYYNVKNLWSLLKLNELKATVATDLKLANISIGIMPHSSTYPGPWCDAKKGELNRCGQYRSLGDCLKNFENWQKAGAKKQCAKNYKNCINKPLFDGNDNDEVIDYLPPPELHLLTGIVNKIYDHMLEDFEVDTLRWTKMCNVERKVAYGNVAFAGNACKTLLNKVDILRSFCNVGCLKYVKCFDDFQLVVSSCFSKELKESFASHINQFRSSYNDLNISVTSKVHTVFFHVAHFCNKTKKGLGDFSEQAVESAHYDFNKTWQKYKVGDAHPQYSARLLRAVQEYNSCHI